MEGQMAKTLTVQDFFKMFASDDACLDHLFKVRFGNLKSCPKCQKETKFHRLAKEKAYACQWCGHHLHPMKGTPFEATHTPLQKWFYAMYLFTTTRHGVPAKELQRQLSVTYKTAWRMGHEIRKYMAIVDGDPTLGGHVEIDETFVGGRKKGGKTGRGSKKAIVLGIVERDGNVYTQHVPSASGADLLPPILKRVRCFPRDMNLSYVLGGARVSKTNGGPVTFGTDDSMEFPHNAVDVIGGCHAPS